MTRTALAVALVFAASSPACSATARDDVAVPTLAPPGRAAPADVTVPASGGARGDAPGAGSPAPGFFGRFLAGGDLTSADVSGTPVVLNFWLTTCEPCIRELPLLAGASDAHEGLIVIGVNYEEDPATITAFLGGLSPRPGFPIVLDPNGEMARAYQVAVFPTTFFIDRDGVIQYRRVGEVRAEHLAVGLERIGVATEG